MRNELWQMHARCRGYPVDTFFPERGGRVGLRRRTETAKQVCRVCPVRSECLEHAVRTPEQHGVWGGTSPAERHVG